MYCAKGFSNASSRLTPVNGMGPDFYAEFSGLRICVEAHVPGPGSSTDAVPDIKSGNIAQESPERQIILLFRSGLEAKLEQWKKWRESDAVKKQDAFIVAFNSRRMQIVPTNRSMPYIVKAVLPLGGLTTVFDSSDKEGDSFYAERSALVKTSGSEVRTDIFLRQEYAEVSAVLSSQVDCFNKPEKEGQDFILVHNPLATVKVPREFLGFGKEYWVSEEWELCDKDWNCE